MPKISRFLIVLALLFSFDLGRGVLQDYLFSQGPYAIDPASLTGEYDYNATRGVFHTDQVASIEQPTNSETRVLGASSEEKLITVDLSTQTLYAFEGENLVGEYLISSGKWGRTPTGTFTIWGKFRYAKMEGGNKALHTYYYLPNVPFVMFFKK